MLVMIVSEEESTELTKERKAIEDLKERVDRLAVMAEKGRGQVEDFTKTNPLPALGIAFLVGIATGAVVVAAAASKK
jgi:hypothetical protein